MYIDVGEHFCEKKINLNSVTFFVRVSQIISIQVIVNKTTFAEGVKA